MKRLFGDPAARYVVRALAWFFFLLGALRLTWVQAWVLVPFAGLQGRAAAALLGKSELGVTVDTSCSGSDALAVCLGAILAYPVSWRRRLTAAAGGFAVITVVNTLRLGSLAQVVGNRPLFDLLHYQIWPALIILAAAGYAFFWMRAVPAGAGSAPGAARPGPLTGLPALPFVTLALVFVAAYYAFYDLLLRSRLLGAAAEGAALTAGGLMTFCGIPARVSGGVLRTASGGWVVTPECVTTPLIPLFIAAVIATRRPWWGKLLLLAVTPALFFLLGIGRLMVLAVPAQIIGSPDVAVHAFYQFVLAAVAVGWLASRRPPGGARPALAALGLGVVTGLVAGTLDLRLLRPAVERLGPGAHLGHGYADPQGVLLLLPGFALGLLAAVWLASARPGGWQALARAADLVAAVGALGLLALGELEAHTGMVLPVVLLRLGSLALPLVVSRCFGWVGRQRDRPSSALRQAASPAA